MSAAGGSAERWAARQRAYARRGVWRRVLAWLGVRIHTRRADARAAACDAGAEGERRTQELLRPLERAGWRVLHDRAIPGAHSANVDHVVISPGERVFLVDSKLWSGRWPVHAVGGRLKHGQTDRSRVLSSLRFEAGLVERALGVPVQPLIAVHNAPVAGGGFFVEGIPVTSADRLVQLLVLNDGPRKAGAVWLARHAERVLPPYRG